MSEFFEVNLPDRAPAYIVNDELRDSFENAVRAIKARSALLNEALALTGMEPNKFHEVAVTFFKEFPHIFDKGTARILADMVMNADDGEPIPDEIKRLEWPNATVLFDTKFTTTQEWETLRHLGIGGSDAAIVYNANKYRTRRSLYHDKIGTPMRDDGLSADNPVLVRGHVLEDDVVAHFCQDTGAVRILESRMFASRTHPTSTANPDAIVRMPSGDIYVFEAKTKVKDNRDAFIGKVPVDYYFQTRQYPAVLDDERITGTFISCAFTTDIIVGGYLFGVDYKANDFISHLVTRDLTEETELLEHESAFMNDYVIAGIEPEADDGFKLNKALEAKIVWVEAEGPDEIVLSSDSAREAAMEYMNAYAAKERWKAQESYHEEQVSMWQLALTRELDGHKSGRIPLENGKYIEVKNTYVSKTSVDTSALKASMPDVYERFVKTSPGYYRFGVKEKVDKKAAKAAV